MEINIEHQLSPCITRFNNTCSLLVATHVLINQVQERSNFIFSPLSFHSMLSLIALGSEGPTLNQLLSFLDIKGVDELNFLASHLVSSIISHQIAIENIHVQSPVVSFINGAWLDQRFKLKPSFQQVVRNVYHATASEVDFLNKADQVREEINSWAERETKGLIRNLLPEEDGLDEETVLVLANALYFKGIWDRPFDASKTEQKDFNLLDGETVQVPFMTTNPNQKHFYASSIDHQVLKVPYRSGRDARKRFSMCFFLPTARDGLAGLVEKIRNDPMMLNNDKHVVEQLLQERNVYPVWIPRFKLSFEVEASSTLREMGLDLPFSDTYGLMGMVESSDPVVLSKMFHKSVIEVNEEGTEAASGTAGRIRGMRCRSAGPPSFVADHPFLFTIMEENSGSVLFIGAVLNPMLVC
ncbi:At1g47710 [Linum grandiflorum]